VKAWSSAGWPTRWCIVLLIIGMLWDAVDEARGDDSAHDIIIRGGTLYDGTGAAGVRADLAITRDKIAAIGDLADSTAETEIDASGKAVTPGFINMLSWSTVSLLADNRAQSDVRQGVTLEVFGEGMSMGPLTDSMRRDLIENQSDIKYEVPWTTLAEYLNHLVDRGTSVNVASFLGATSVRIHVIGYEDRPPTADELERMRAIVRQAMEEGAMGIGSSLIYAPAFYASTDELIELCKVAAEYGGMYISHLRSEGNQLLVAVDELLRIAREADIAAEIYHLKAAGRENWPKLDRVIQQVEAARAAGHRITANMYTYTAGATGLNATMPPWVQEGGFERWRDRLRDPRVRDRVLGEMRRPTDQWENLLMMAGSAENVLLAGFKNPDLRHLAGKTLAEVAARRNQLPETTAMDLVIQDGSRVDAVYFLMSEDNIRKKVALPWISFGSDAPAVATAGVFLRNSQHPRAYGNFSRLLAKYVRDEKIISLETAIHRLTGLPAKNLGVSDRGRLAPGCFADVVVFDPDQVQDHATFDQPHQYSTGIRDVLVNGVAVLRDGEHTGATPGKVVHGPGRR